MKKNICPICSSISRESFAATVLQKYEAAFYCCPTCGFLWVQEPHWQEEAYSSAIASTDTGLVSRNIAIAAKLAAMLYFLMDERGSGRYVDVAGGYGMLTRLMRDYGFDFYWADKYCQNLMARGFEYIPEMGKCTAVTAIEVLEHVEDPVGFVDDALKYGQADTLIFTTELYEGNPPLPDQWWYYSMETGQHVSFFQRRTLDTLAGRLGLHLTTNGWLHIVSRKKFNEQLFKICSGRLSNLTTRWVRKQLAGKMIRDHKALVQQLSNKL